MSAIADLLADLADSTGMSDTDLARALGVSQPTFTRWRNGRLGVGERHAERIAVLARRPVDEVRTMLDGQQQRPPSPSSAGETVADLLVAWSDQRGGTAAALAAECGTSLSMFLRWRKALVIPAAGVLEHLAATIGVPVERMVMAWYRSHLGR